MPETSSKNTKSNGSKSTKKDKKNIAEVRFSVNIKTVFFVFFTLLFIFYIYNSFSREVSRNLPEKTLTQIMQDVKAKKVAKLQVVDTRIIAEYTDKKLATAVKESNQSLSETLKDYDINPASVSIEIQDTQTSAAFMNFLANLIPTILMVAFFIFLFRQAKGAQESVFSFGQSKAKRFNKDLPKTTFKDVAGVDEAKNELEEVVDFLKNPEKYKKVGARTPKGVILVGPAGCGKTLLAKAVAGEANVPFFSIAGSEFMEMLVGIGAARVRDLFATAKKSAPSIIFIDEVDAIGRARSVGVMPSHDEREQTLNQILVEMDGFNPTEQVVVIAATNRGDLLDPALLRPGRFDRRVVVDFPEIEGRKAIIAIHAKGKPFADDIDWDKVARRTVGYSGADLENMLNEAAISAARKALDKITMEAIEEAATKVKMGPEKKRLQSELDRKLTAYHEAGHAIVSHFMPHTDSVHRISIVSRGMALGFTLIPPGKDKLHETKTHLLERIAVMLGGRAAEEIVFNETTTGASNDFDQATSVARNMVTEFGMSALGPVNYGPSMDITRYGSYDPNTISQDMMAKIDQEIRNIIDVAYKQALDLINKQRKELDGVAQALLEHENLDQIEFEKIVGDKPNGKEPETLLAVKAE